MKTLMCQHCQGSFQTNDMFLLLGNTLCNGCTDKALAARGTEPIPAGSFGPLTDPTVCVRCKLDNGSSELTRLGGHPVCPSCEDFFRNRPFPDWIRRALVALGVLALASLLHSQRFVSAYVQLARSNRAVRRGDLEAAAGAMERARKLVPEVSGLDNKAAFLRGILLMQQDRPAEALPLLTKAKAGQPGNAMLERAVLSAQIGVAFDAKDYDRFLQGSREILRNYPADPFAEAGVASAYACQFAVSGKEELRQEALSHLEKGARLATGDARFKEYEDRIRYRLETREILSRGEYVKRFPHGRNQ